MNILVTGGAGYIGSHVVLDLLDSGHEVTVLDDLSLGFEKNVDVRAKFIRGSTLSEQDLKTAFSTGPDAVIHLAAWKAAGESMVHPGKYSINNIIGTLKLLMAMVDSGVQKMIFSSSAAIYGYPEYLPVDEKHRTDPINYYGYTKLAIEDNLRWYSRLKGISFVSLRYFNAAGYDSKNRVTEPEQNPQNLLPIVMEVATGKRDKLEIYGDDYNTADGTCIRDYIHVSDLASAHTKAIHFLQREGKDLLVNLGTGCGHSVLDVVREAKQITKHPIPSEFVERRPGDPEELIASFEMATDVLKWTPVHSGLNHILHTMWEILHPKENSTKPELT
ncbi:MAG: UDP-glucose 4-epimerase GalE [Candidatus Marinimicrobia bacterium]|nr:UDP-glucose 4-epimerase GalE [Candidatus Neomarinimicrobiota bacterium]